MSVLAIILLLVVLCVAFGGWGLAGSPVWLLALVLLLLLFFV
jgi:hypothetical protein